MSDSFGITAWIVLIVFVLEVEVNRYFELVIYAE